MFSGYTVNGTTDLDLIFTQTGTKDAAATNYKVANADLNTRYAKSRAVDDRSSTATNYRVNGSDLNTIFRRAGFVTVSAIISAVYGETVFWDGSNYTVSGNPATLNAAASNGTGTYSYAWTNLTSSGPIASITNASSATCTLSAAYQPFDFDNTFQCVVTDTGTSETASGTVTITFSTT